MLNVERKLNDTLMTLHQHRRKEEKQKKRWKSECVRNTSIVYMLDICVSYVEAVAQIFKNDHIKLNEKN